MDLALDNTFGHLSVQEVGGAHLSRGTVGEEIDAMRRFGRLLSDMVFQQQLLEGASRSFAFTIPELPWPLRNVVANAYLLFRAADTIEDEDDLTLEQKQLFWEELIASVSGKEPSERLRNDLPHLLSPKTLPAERAIFENLPRLIHITRSLNAREREALERSIRLMCGGMSRYQVLRSPGGLERLSDLNDYCYHVAGVVGEFLTDVFCNYSAEIAEKREILRTLAISFGQGLQMTNILKDLWKDLDRGTCWLPRDIFGKNGFDLKDLSRECGCDSFHKGLSQLIAITYGHLKNGLAYTLLIPRKETGIRKFCLWAIGLAIFTLKKLRRISFPYTHEVKVTRRWVRAMIWTTHLTVRGNGLLRMLFVLSTRGLARGSDLEGPELACANL